MELVMLASEYLEEFFIVVNHAPDYIDDINPFLCSLCAQFLVASRFYAMKYIWSKYSS
jgi:hypothetical protein